MSQKENVKSLINIADIYDGMVTSFNFHRTQVYEYEGFDMIHTPSVELDRYKHNIAELIKGLNANQSLCFLNRFDYDDTDTLDDYQQRLDTDTINDDPTLKAIRDDHIEFLKKVPYRTQKQYLYITQEPKYKPRKKWFSINRHHEQSDHYDLRSDVEQSLKTIATSVSNVVKECALRPLQDQAIFDLCFNLLNDKKSRNMTPIMRKTDKDDNHDLIEEYPFLKNRTVRDQIMHSAIDNSDHNFFEIDGIYYTTVSVTMLPTVCELDVILRMLRIPLSYDMHVRVTMPDQKEEMLDEIKKRRTRVRLCENANSLFSRGSKVTEAHQLDEIDTAEKVIDGQLERLLKVSFTFVVKHDNKKKCEQKGLYIEKELNSLRGMQAMRAGYSHLENFLSILPGCHDLSDDWLLPIYNTELARLIPFHRNWTGTKDVQMVFRNTSNELIPLSFEKTKPDIPIATGIVMGLMGSGKSAFINSLVTKRLLHNPKDFNSIVDVGGSYKKLHCAFKKQSTYLSFDYDENFAITFFPSKQIFEQESKGENKIVPELSSLIFITAQLNLGRPYTPSETFLIESGIQEMYKGLKADESPILQDYQAALSRVKCRDEEDKKFITEVNKNLDLFTDPKNPRSKLLNKRGSLNPTSPLVIFDFSKLDTDPILRTIYMFVTNNFLVNRMVNFPDRRQSIILDEAWKYLAVESSQDAIKGIYRTGRKHGSDITCVGQFASDYSGHHMAPIRNGSYVKYIFEIQDHDVLAKTVKDESGNQVSEWNFNSSELDSIKSIRNGSDYRQCFVKWGKNATKLHLNLSPFEQQLYATDFESLNKYGDVLKEDINLVAAIKEAIRS